MVQSWLRLAAVLAVCACVCASASTAVAQEDAVARANRSAYDAAMTCFVAAGVAAGDFKKAGNVEKASALEGKARTSFDTAVRLGRSLGYTGEHMDEDFGLTQTRELPRMMSDTAYYRSEVAICKALGLM
jgi:hypothetical protein